MADKLSIMNYALTSIEQTTIESLTDVAGGEALRLLNRNWDRSVAKTLESGNWNFAIRILQILPDPDISTAFGFRNAFTKPEDWVRTQQVALDENFRMACRRYIDQGGWWYADDEVLFVRYVSRGDQYGLNVGGWTQAFADAVALELATTIAPKITTSDEVRERTRRMAVKALVAALSLDAAAQPSDPLPNSSWVRSRGRGNPYMGSWR